MKFKWEKFLLFTDVRKNVAKRKAWNLDFPTTILYENSRLWNNFMRHFQDFPRNYHLKKMKLKGNKIAFVERFVCVGLLT